MAFRTLLIILVASILLFGFFAAIPLLQFYINQQITASEVPTISTSSDAQMIFVGDVMLARDVEIMMGRYGTEYPFSNIREHLAAETVVGNFEASVPEEHIPTPHFNTRFSVEKSLLPILHASGFTHVSLANNHTYDYGELGFKNTQKTLQESGLTTFGSPDNATSTSLAYVEINNIRVAIVGLHTVDVIPNAEEITDTIDQATDSSDIQIAYVHWGSEYKLHSNTAQKSFAYSLINAGIDAVIGHHPHVVQEIEIYNDAPIFYSLGNFIFDQYFSTDVQTGLMLKLSFDRDLFATTLIPISSKFSRTSPRVLSGHERELFLKELSLRSHPVLQKEIQSGTLTFEIRN